MFASFLIHNRTPWKTNTSRWDLRTIEFLYFYKGKIHLDERYPKLALILAEAPVDEAVLEHMFRLSPTEDFSVFVFSEVAADYPIATLFDEMAAKKNIPAIA